MPDVKSVQYICGHRLDVAFDDGVQGEIDLKPHIVGKGGVFEPLESTEFFSRVSVNHEIGTIVWPNDADLSPEFLYTLVLAAGNQSSRRASA